MEVHWQALMRNAAEAWQVLGVVAMPLLVVSLRIEKEFYWRFFNLDLYVRRTCSTGVHGKGPRH
jgi:hypothetical protein